MTSDKICGDTWKLLAKLFLRWNIWRRRFVRSTEASLDDGDVRPTPGILVCVREVRVCVCVYVGTFVLRQQNLSGKQNKCHTRHLMAAWVELDQCAQASFTQPAPLSSLVYWLLCHLINSHIIIEEGRVSECEMLIQSSVSGRFLTPSNSRPTRDNQTSP